MTYKIVNRVDDGTFDLFGKFPDGRVDNLGNFDTLDEAKDEIKKMKSPMSRSEALEFLKQIKI